MNEDHKYIDFETYERVAEPHKRERASAWRTAIGLQDVDGLRVSEYLKETAVKHIEGDITIDEVREQLRSYAGLLASLYPKTPSSETTVFNSANGVLMPCVIQSIFQSDMVRCSGSKLMPTLTIGRLHRANWC